MKKVACLLVVLSVFAVGCASIATKDKLTTQVVIDIPNEKKADIYKKTLEWLASSFGSGKQVLEYQNEADGKIIGNIATTGYISVIVPVTFQATMTIEIKDSKARITYIFNSVRNVQWDSGRGLFTNEVRDATKTLKPVTQSYKSYMSEKKDSSNW